MACPNCGSWSVKADRSLGGRMVCGRCGRPLGPGVTGSSRARRGGRLGGLARPGRWRTAGPLTWLLVLLGLGAGLALLEPGPPSPGPGGPSPQRPLGFPTS